MWIKFCGMVREEDVEAACEFGVSAVGFIFVPSSPRVVGVSDVQRLRLYVRAQCTTVAVFQNHDMSEVKEIAEELDIGLLQFHGSESADDIERLQHPFIKAFRVKPEFNLSDLLPYQNADAWLLDSAQSGLPVPAEFVRRAIDMHPHGRVVLAGGLMTENVRSRIDECRPYGVDVARGIEQYPRVKNFEKMREFIRVCRNTK